ncbi:hypothetical protein YDYSG_08810 [Paenibacillus tyrfis]|uniref:hypothetical protein n=1 Tax=Paenibacillus tyrfis TaxID=1501230 RepID=UPI0024935E7F|nr:hypothetical protein [Paenibacillus tyrfis]GLI04851.1 hypothetical protein YDYSG_08810 [Paenibacillus tyrfis]
MDQTLTMLTADTASYVLTRTRAAAYTMTSDIAGKIDLESYSARLISLFNKAILPN